MPGIPALIPPLAALRSFEAVARLGGFARAAAELNVSTSAVSHQIRGLEASLGVRLIDRSVGTGDARVTRQGARLLRAVEATLIPLGEACEALRGHRSRRRRRLTVSANSPFLTLWLAPRLTSFSAMHADVDVRGETVDGAPDLERADIDLAILHLRRDHAASGDVFLLDETVFPVCSPDLLRATPDLLGNPRALLSQRLLQEDHPDSPETDWTTWSALLGLPALADNAMMRFNSFGPTIGAAIAGSGVALGRSPQVDYELRSGRLHRLLPRVSLQGSWQYFMRVRPRLRDEPALRDLCTFLLKEAESR